MTEYRYIFASDLPRYQAEGWELCGPMKGERYAGGHQDTVIVKRDVAENLGASLVQEEGKSK